MQYPKRAGFIVAAVCFMFFAACEGERRVGNSSEDNPFVQISISQVGTAKMRLGESKTLNVTPTNTDFTLSSPAGAGCVKNGATTVICTPVSEGKYDIKVTATADTKKSAATTITVEFVSISISPATAIVKRDEPAEFTVSANGHFELSTTSQSRHDAYCHKDPRVPDRVFCAPEFAGTYAVTVIAADGTTDTASFTTLIGISPNVVEKGVKVKEEFAVFDVNATDFTVSTTPATNITCVKNGSEVICVPLNEGFFIITVTLNDDSDNKDEALLRAIK